MKRIKKTYLLFLIIIVLVSLSLYSTFALFATSSTIDNVVDFDTTLTINSNILEGELITVPASETRIIELNISNNYESNLYYGVWYELVSSSDISNINLGLYTSENATPATGAIASGTSLQLLVGIQNIGSEEVMINLGTVGSLTSSLGLESPKELIPSNWKKKGPSYEKIDSSSANAPGYVENLVPVMHNGATWVTADVTSSTSTYGWYDYNARKWANAVLLTEAKRNSLTQDANGNYTPGQAIGDTEAEGALAFYVWIPRYKYKVWNINKTFGTTTYNAQNNGIDIVFENGTETTGGVTCTYSYSTSTNEKCTNSGDGYYTHPAFTLGNDQLTGIWMGKFELSNPDELVDGTSVTLLPRVLPNMKIWSINYIGYFWKVIKDMQKVGNMFGLSTDVTEVDSHMLTNMEWGAVAYLTHSKYGRCSGGCVEVSINNSYRTGRGIGKPGNNEDMPSASEWSGSRYDTPTGQLSSTTANIYGIYDMSGGNFEYVMGNVSKTSGSYSYNIGYSKNTNYTYSGNEKYLTTYKYGTSHEDYNSGRLGDATIEIVIRWSGDEGYTYTGWYDDMVIFPTNTEPWFHRGGYAISQAYAGIFYFSRTNGTIGNNGFSTRPTLATF